MKISISHFVVLVGTLLCSTSTVLVSAWSSSSSSSSTTNNPKVMSRQEAFQTMGKWVTTGWLVSSSGAMMTLPTVVHAAETLPSGVTYEIVKSGDGPKPEIGELVAIRFAAYCGDTKIDDIFETPEPYYTRLGSGGLLSGVETTLPYMRLGDRWKLTIPGNLAFGTKGRPASAGKPRIPADAIITFDVEMVGLPGKEPELIELIGTVDE